MNLVPIAASLQIGAICLFATSSVIIRSGRAYEGLTPLTEDCLSKDKTIKAVRIEAAIFDDNGREIRRATVRSCTKTDSEEQAWVFTLDDHGIVLKRDHYITRFDEHGRQIEYVMRAGNEGTISTGRYQSKYDAVGRLVETRTADEDGTTNRVEFSLDDGGDAVVTTSIDSDGEISGVTRSRYDDQHHLVFESSDGDGAGEARSFKYDAQGRMVEQVSGRGETRTVLLNAYDVEGRLLSYRQLVGSAQPRTWTGGYAYWPNGLIQEEWSFDDLGGPLRFESYAYDDHEHYTQEWVYTPGHSDNPKKFTVLVDGHLQTFGETNGLPLITYSYDAHGNWVKAVETRLSSPEDPSSRREVSAVFYRQLEYR